MVIVGILAVPFAILCVALGAFTFSLYCALVIQCTGELEKEDAVRPAPPSRPDALYIPRARPRLAQA